MGRTTTDAAADHPEGEAGHPVLALGVLVVSLSLALAGLVLTFVARPEWGINQWFWAVDTVDAVVYGVAAWLVLGRLRHPISWILAVTAVGGGLAAVGAQWTLVWFEHQDLPELGSLQLMQGLAWVPGTLALIVVLPWLVRGGRLGPLARLAVAAGGTLIAFTTFVRLTDPFTGYSAEPLSPVAIRNESWEDFISRSAPWENGILVALGLVATVALLARRRREPVEGRLGLAWLATAVAVLSISFLPLTLPAGWSAHLPLAFTPLLHLVSQAIYPAAILGVVLRQRLWGLDLAVRRTLTWWLLTSGLVVAYVSVVALLGELLPGDGGSTRVLATAAVAAGFQPARAWVQRGVDALVHGEATQPMQVVRQVGRTLGGASGPDDLLTGLLDGLVGSLRLGGARIESTDGRVAVEVGEVDGRAVVVPLVHQQTGVGRLWAQPRPNERLDGPSLRRIEEVAGPVVGATLVIALASQDLERSRARLAEARDEERRVLRRELHDGLGPALAGIGLGLQASRNLLERDPAAATDLLDALAVELDARVEEVRGLARGLLPPALEELGLAPALVELAERHRAAGLAVDLEVGDLPPLAPEVGSAVYGIVAEAVRNVDRHAAATRCRITADGGDGLVVVVADDGVGIGPDAVIGVGTRSMRERAEGIGGTVEVGPVDPRGTQVVVRVPVAGRPGGLGPGGHGA